MISIWDNAEDSHRQIRWAHEIGEAMKPYMTTGFYLNNFCGESPSQVRESYGENWERLAQIKKLYDPTNVFQANPNISLENWNNSSVWENQFFKENLAALTPYYIDEK